MALRDSPAVPVLRRAAIVAVLAAGLAGVGAPAVAAAPADDPAGSPAATSFPAAPDAGLGEVRADSADPTAAVAGGVVVLVAGFTTLVAARPPRPRPPVDRVSR